MRGCVVWLGDLVGVLRGPARSRILRAYEAGRRQGRREALDELATPGLWIDLGVAEAERYANGSRV